MDGALAQPATSARRARLLAGRLVNFIGRPVGVVVHATAAPSRGRFMTGIRAPPPSGSVDGRSKRCGMTYSSDHRASRRARSEPIVMSVKRRNNVITQGAGPATMVFAHGFGCDQNMWRFVA